MKKLTNGLLRPALIICLCFLLSISSFVLTGCNGSGNNTQGTQPADSTSNNVSTDSPKIMTDTSKNMADSSNPKIDTSGGKDVNGGKDKKKP